MCLAACTRDADCRAGEGYVCDPAWHACSLPNLAAIVAPHCPGPAPRDLAFGDSEPWGTGTQPSGAIAPGRPGFVAVFDTSTGIEVTPERRDDGPRFAAVGHDAVLARGAAGLYAAWRDAEAIELATSRDGQTWSPPAAVQADDGSLLGRPILAAGNRLYVMYGAGDTGLRVRASKDGGKTFTPGVTPLAGTYGNAVIDDAGALHVVTLNGDEHGGYGSAQQRIEYARSSDGGATFTAPRVVSLTDELLPTYYANPSIAVDTRRRWLYIAYVRGGRDAHWDLVIAATRDGGTTWTRRTIGDGCAIHLVPNLALDPVTGTLHVAYYDNAGVIGRFVHATCTPGAAACTERGTINTQRFAALPLGRRGATSIGDHESLFIDAQRRTLHALWAQPVAENGRTVSRVFHATATLR